MNVIIFGSNGMLGKYVKEYFIHKNIQVICNNRERLHGGLDIFVSFKNENLYTDLMEIIPDNSIVINCAGITNKRPGISVEEMYVVNSIFPMVLDRVCDEKNCNFIHISTDCVFTGNKISLNASYSSNKEYPDSTNSYGMSKQFGERLLYGGLVIRTSIIGEEYTNHPCGLLEWVRNNPKDELLGYTNHYWNGVTCLELAKQIYHLSKDKWEYYPGQILQISSEKVSKYELVKMIVDVYSLDKNVIPFEDKQFCDRSLVGDIQIQKSLREQIIEMKDF